ncbi:MAG: hypothetical protein LBD24_08200 [Spirochaetaceae bacterium]|jgi:hypothetical protein|nr:hypothetical protein [Spirochaetaceae bacterium]
MKHRKQRAFCMTGLLATALVFGTIFVGCDDSGDSDDSDGGIIPVTHVKGFQGNTRNGSLLEIQVPSTANGPQTFTLYINGENSGTGTLTISSGAITALTCTNSSLMFYEGGVVTYSGDRIELRPADDKVWVHWGVYYDGTMADFNLFASQHNRDADRMYDQRPSPNDQGNYDYDTSQNIYERACRDFPDDRPPPEVINQAVSMLNNHRNTGVGAYVSRGNLIAYYFRRVR